MRRRTRRHPLTSLLWFVILAVLFFSAIPLLAGLGQQLGSLYVGRLMPDAPPVVTAPAVSAEPVAEEPQRQGDCHALSAETLSTYVKEPVWALHEPGGDCLWVTDRSDPRSAVVVVDWLEAYVVAHLSGDAPLVSESFDPVTRSRTSVLLARPIQWIPVADTRTEVRWPMRVRIMRDPLAITHERADQILRAVAADLNREAAVP